MRSSNSIVVTESPLMLAACYAMRHDAPCWEHLGRISREFDKRYPALNFFIDRADLPYKPTGRFEDLQDALKMDKVIMGFLRKNKMPFYIEKYNELEEMLNISENFIAGTPRPKASQKI